MAEERKSFLLRLPPELWKELEKWAADELRSVNGQIEYVLRQAVAKRRGRRSERVESELTWRSCSSEWRSVLVLFASAHAQDAFVGRWVLDPASYEGCLPAWLRRAATMEVTAAGGGKYTVHQRGRAWAKSTRRSEVTYAVDGKDYAVTSTPVQPGARR